MAKAAKSAPEAAKSSLGTAKSAPEAVKNASDVAKSVPEAAKGSKSAEGAKKNIHAGHRERLRRQVAERGLRGMPDHLVLEYLLFYVIPQKDTNPLAHALIDRFGSLTGVLDANIEELTDVAGVGMTTALFLKTIQMVDERYALEKIKGRDKNLTIDDFGRFLTDYYRSKTEEEVYVFFLDNGGGVIGSESVYKGTVNSTFVAPRTLAEAAFRYKAASIIIAHNHPEGDVLPSDEDINLTRRLMDSFIPFDITIRAHLIVAGDRYADLLPIMYERMHVQKPRYIAIKSPQTEGLHGSLEELKKG